MKKIELNIEDIFNIPSSVIYNPDAFKSINHVSIDSRNIKKSTLFIAIKGERFDGHDFVDDAVKSGACALMVNKKNFKSLNEVDVPVITVKDTTKALGDVAKIWRSKLNAKVIGISGSAGKTTTKEILATLLSQKFKVNKTVANNNNHIGVPLTILSTSENHNILVAELGTNHFGEISYTASIAGPDMAIITNIGDSHLEFLKNRTGVLKEKVALFNETIKRGGKVFINNDDRLLKEIGKKIKNKSSIGLVQKAEYKAKVLGYDKLARPQIQIDVKNKKNVFTVTLPISGEKNVLNFTAAFAVAAELGVSKTRLLKGCKKIKSFSKRLEIKNLKKFTLINDTYNANPDSMRSSLEILGRIEARKKIAVLGDMYELGKQSEVKHRELSGVIRELNIDEVYTTGKMMSLMDRNLRLKSGIHRHFSDRDSLKRFLKILDINNSAVLIKGSRGMKMEEFVSVLETRKN